MTNSQPSTAEAPCPFADELRTAATKLRELATAASTDDDGTPTADWHAKPCGSCPGVPDDGNRIIWGDRLQHADGSHYSWPKLLHGGSQHRPVRMRARHAEYIVAMGPRAGLALADWLEFEADLIDSVPGAELRGRTEHALAVARQILGTTP